MSYSKNKRKKSLIKKEKKYYITDKIGYWNNQNKFIYENRKEDLFNKFDYETKQCCMIEYNLIDKYDKINAIYRFVAYKINNDIKENNPWNFNIAHEWLQWDLHWKMNKSGYNGDLTIIENDLNLNYDKIFNCSHVNVNTYFNWRNFKDTPELSYIKLLEDIETYIPVNKEEQINSIDNNYPWLIQRCFIGKNKVYHHVTNEIQVSEYLNTILIPNYLVKPKTSVTKMDKMECYYCEKRKNTYKKHYKGDYWNSELTEELVNNGYHYYNSKLSNNQYNLSDEVLDNIISINELFDMIKEYNNINYIPKKLFYIIKNSINLSIDELCLNNKNEQLLDMFRKGYDFYHTFGKLKIVEYNYETENDPDDIDNKDIMQYSVCENKFLLYRDYHYFYGDNIKRINI